MIASIKSHYEVIKLFLTDSGIDVNKIIEAALIYASTKDYHEIVKMLLF